MNSPFPADGSLVGWWCPSLDDAGDGTSSVTDLVGSNDSVLTSHAAWQVDTDNGGARAINLDGVGDDCTMAAAAVSAYPFSMSAWVNLDTQVKAQGVVAIGDFSATNQSIGFRVNPSGLWNLYVYNSTFVQKTGTAASTAGWDHLVAVFVSATERRLYLNGVLDISDTTSVSFPSNVDRTRIGRFARSTGGNDLDGLWDDVRIMNKALSVGEVTTLYNSDERAYEPGGMARLIGQPSKLIGQSGGLIG